jgi:hypothetical protein
MIRKAGPQEPIGYVPPPVAVPEIGYDSQPAAPNPIFQLPGAQPRPELGGMTPYGFVAKLDKLSEAEAIAFLDQLTAPPK